MQKNECKKSIHHFFVPSICTKQDSFMILQIRQGSCASHCMSTKAYLLYNTPFQITSNVLHDTAFKVIKLLKDWNTKAQFDLISFSKLMAPVMSWKIVYIVSQIVLYLFIFISYYMFSSKAFELCFQIHQNDLLYYYIYLDNWYTTTHL